MVPWPHKSSNISTNRNTGDINRVTILPAQQGNFLNFIKQYLFSSQSFKYVPEILLYNVLFPQYQRNWGNECDLRQVLLHPWGEMLSRVGGKWVGGSEQVGVPRTQVWWAWFLPALSVWIMSSYCVIWGRTYTTWVSKYGKPRRVLYTEYWVMSRLVV